MLLNSHGGNSALISQVALDLRARFGVLVVPRSWARFGYPDGLFSETELRHGIHGGEIETSLMLAFRPELVDMARAKNFLPATLDFERDFAWLRADRPAGFGWMAQDLSPAGRDGRRLESQRRRRARRWRIIGRRPSWNCCAMSRRSI